MALAHVAAVMVAAAQTSQIKAAIRGDRVDQGCILFLPTIAHLLVYSNASHHSSKRKLSRAAIAIEDDTSGL